jgi:hypothetical protein
MSEFIECKDGFLSDEEMRRFLNLYLPVDDSVSQKEKENNAHKRQGARLYHNMVKAFREVERAKINAIENEENKRTSKA